MATFFLRIRSRFSYKLNKIYWELPFLENSFQVFWLMCGFNRKRFGKWASNIWKVCFWPKMIYFDQKWSKIDNFFESGPQMVPRWSPEVPKTDNFLRPVPKTDNFLRLGPGQGCPEAHKEVRGFGGNHRHLLEELFVFLLGSLQSSICIDFGLQFQLLFVLLF